jgi:glutamine cyclotransferase
MKVKKAASAGVLAAMVTLVAAPAFAVGSFTYTIDMTHSVDSRDWTQGGGTTTITSTLTCGAAGGSDSYYVELFKNKVLADQSMGRKNHLCGSATDTSTWTGLPSGDYHFTIRKSTDGQRWTGGGKVTYP